MILYKKNSRHHITDLLSEFILNELGNNCNSIIEVMDCTNFYVIRGSTTSDKIINLYDVIKKFDIQYEEFLPPKKIMNVIDLIQYCDNITSPNIFKINLFRSDNPLYSKEQLNHLTNHDTSCSHDDIFMEISEDSNFIKSQYPFGYSKNLGKVIFEKMIIVGTKFINESTLNKLSITYCPTNNEMIIFDGNNRHIIDSKSYDDIKIDEYTKVIHQKI
jgi:hypothetical protein